MPVTLEELKKKIDFLVVDGVPVEVLLGTTDMERLDVQINLAG